MGLALLSARGADEPKERVDYDRSENRKRADAVAETIEKRSKESGQTFSIEKPKYTEKWMYSMLGDNLEFLKISHFQDHTKYSEAYYLQRGQLIYAIEGEDRYSGHDEQSEAGNRWTAYYYFEDGKLAYYLTGGHGKFEDDEWDPDPAGAFRARLKTLKKELKRAAVMQTREEGKDR